MTRDRLAAAQHAYPVWPGLLPDKRLRAGRYELRFAHTPEELDAILRLRFEVFNLELGEGLAQSFASGRDLDRFDAVTHHLLVEDRSSGAVVGSYRMQTSDMAAAHLGFYSDLEFDLSTLPSEVLEDSLELGRACIAREHRSIRVLFLLWRGLAIYVAAHRKRFLFGCSSLTSQDPREGLAAMEYLERHGHVHPDVRVLPRPECVCTSEGTGSGTVRVKIPTLFRIYLGYGAKVCGPPAIDREFKTIDWLMLFDIGGLDERTARNFLD